MDVKYTAISLETVHTKEKEKARMEEEKEENLPKVGAKEEEILPKEEVKEKEGGIITP